MQPLESKATMNSVVTDIDEQKFPTLDSLSDTAAESGDSSENDSIGDRHLVDESEHSLGSNTSHLVDVHYESVNGDQPNSQHPRKKSVRFSLVTVREYPVIEEPPSADSEDDEGPRRSLAWEYTEKEARDVESHLVEIEKERDDKYSRMINEHIRRALEREEEAAMKEELEKKKGKGVKGMAKRMLKGIVQGIVAASQKSSSSGLVNVYSL